MRITLTINIGKFIFSIVFRKKETKNRHSAK